MSKLPTLDWRHAGPDLRIAEGHYAGWRYELERVHPPYGTPYWMARFFDTDDARPQVLADHVNFIQARQKVLAHHHHPGY